MSKVDKFGERLPGNLLLATAALASLLASPAFAQTAEQTVTTEQAAQPEDRERVVVTGSRIRRSDTTTSAPVAVIDNQALTDRGFTQVGQALNDATAITPNIPINPGDGGSSGGGEQYPNLFGLGPERTLTLVNGRRFVSTTSAFGGGANDSVVDTNMIPVGLLKQVEIVQGGGGAVYGTDAIGGVINYIYRDDFEGFEADAQYSISSRDDYPLSAARLTWGRNINDRGNIAVNVDWSRSEPLFTRDRPESARNRVTQENPDDTGPDDGIPAVRDVFNARFWEFNSAGVLFAPPDPTSFPDRAFITLEGAPFNQFVPGSGTPVQFGPTGALTAFNPGTFASQGPSIPFASGGDGYLFSDLGALYSGVERANFTAIGHYDLTPSIRLSGEFLFAHVEGEDPIGSLPSNTILNSDDTGSGPIFIAGDNAFLNADAQSTIISYLNNNFGPGAGFGWAFGGAPLPVFLSKIWTDLTPTLSSHREADTYRGVLALDGNFTAADNDFYWSVSLSRAGVDGGTRSWDIWQDRFNNAIDSVLVGGTPACRMNADGDPSNDDPACAPINPFGLGNVSRAATNYVSVLSGQNYLNTQTDFLATLGGDLLRLPSGNLAFSVAYERREEEAKFTPLAADQAGIVRGSIVEVPQKASYNTNEFSAELLAPIVGKDFKLPLVEEFQVSGAYRFVDNSIAGEEEVWNAGFRWTTVPGLILRASRGRNFRAPNLSQLFSPTTAGLEAIGSDPCDSDRLTAGPNPMARLANCQALFDANPAWGPLADFQDPAENFPSVTVTRGGNRDLANELSDTTTYGFVLQPHFAPGLTIIADRVEIELTNGLSQFEPSDFLNTCFDSVVQPADICALTIRDPATGHVTTSAGMTFNAGSIVFKGETYNVNYRFPIAETIGWGGDWGNLELNLEATHTDLVRRSVTGFDHSTTSGTIAAPDWRARFDARFDRGPLRLAYTLSFLSEADGSEGANVENSTTPVIDANYRHSVSGAYDINEALQIRAGVENLTDEGPSYPTLSYGDILGRQYYVGVRARF